MFLDSADALHVDSDRHDLAAANPDTDVSSEAYPYMIVYSMDSVNT